MKQAATRILKPLFILVSFLFVFTMTGPGENVPAPKNPAAPAGTGELNKGEILAKAASLAVPFVKNIGQFDAKAKYAADLFSGRFFLTNDELVYSLIERSAGKRTQPGKSGPKGECEKNLPDLPEKGITIREFFVNHNGTRVSFKSSGENQAPTVVSYFKGKDPGKWRSGIASYQSVSLGEVYPGVEVKLKASGKNVEKIFYVSPQSNAAAIKIGVAGVDGLKIAADGRLVLPSGLGDLAMRAPIAWQEIAGKRCEVSVGYRLLGKHLYGFAISGAYAKDRTLIIDPSLDTLMASTFLGGHAIDAGNSLVLDGFGNVYLTGETSSADFPMTTGAYDANGHHRDDVFVAKLNSSLTTLLASTYIGGNLDDQGTTLALDNSGNVIVAGQSASGDFPTTVKAFDRTFNPVKPGVPDLCFDVFIAKLDSGLTTLLASTYLGGSRAVQESLAQDRDMAHSLALDGSGCIYLTGETSSPDFPITPGAYDKTYEGGKYGCTYISKLDNNLSRLLASTFLDGSDADSALALDSEGNVYVAGKTVSSNFPTTPGAYDQVLNDIDAVFVSKLNSGLTKLLASTLLEGDEPERVHSLALDTSGNVYLAGITQSFDFPTTTGAYQEKRSSLYHSDIFVSKLDGNLTSLLASTYLGGSAADYVFSLALDGSGAIYLTGYTDSPDFPITFSVLDPSSDRRDAFVTKLDNDLSNVVTSTCIGGIYGDNSYCLAIDKSGNIYITGRTQSPNFPTTAGAFQGYKANYYDAFVAKLNGGSSVSLRLSAERREVRAFSIIAQYGQIRFTVKSVDIDAVRFRVMRRQGGGDPILINLVNASELQNNEFQMQDKYLEKDVPYTYWLEAYDADGRLVGRSTGKTI